jgi:chitin synthase
MYMSRRLYVTVYLTNIAVVPDDFKTLRSQRRRWINSTIHNLMELVQVEDLCGIFCFSMQFVVLMDLLGTTVLPGGLLVTYYLIFDSIFEAITQPEMYTLSTGSTQIVITASMVFVIFMPAVLVLLTGKRYNYIGWMFVYLAALPVWQFILPIYAFWHFDDFSWGETRKVAGDDNGHEDGGLFDGRKIPLKRWKEYETEWRSSVMAKRNSVIVVSPAYRR